MIEYPYIQVKKFIVSTNIIPMMEDKKILGQITRNHSIHRCKKKQQKKKPRNNLVRFFFALNEQKQLESDDVAT